MSFFRFSGFLTALVLVTAISGCGGPGESKLEGSALLDGQPLAGGEIVFYAAASPNTPALTVRTDTAGKFSVKLPGKVVLAPGSYNVFVRKWVDMKGQVPNEEDFGMLQAANQLKNVLPKKYGDPSFPLLKAEVKAGQNTLEPINVTSK